MPRGTPEERRLATWVVDQRMLRKKRHLDPSQERELNSIGFDQQPVGEDVC